jgi:hypothetical protein
MRPARLLARQQALSSVEADHVLHLIVVIHQAQLTVNEVIAIPSVRRWQLVPQIGWNRVHATPEIAIEHGADRDLGAQRRVEPVAVAQPRGRGVATLLVPGLDGLTIVIGEVPMLIRLLIGPLTDAVLRGTWGLRRGREGRHTERSRREHRCRVGRHADRTKV